MCSTSTENVSLFWIAQFISRLRDAIGGQIAKEIIVAQLQSLATKSRLFNRIKVEVIRLLSLSKLEISIVTVYQKAQ
jgi:hypothetical protein